MNEACGSTMSRNLVPVRVCSSRARNGAFQPSGQDSLKPDPTVALFSQPRYQVSCSRRTGAWEPQARNTVVPRPVALLLFMHPDLEAVQVEGVRLQQLYPCAVLLGAELTGDGVKGMPGGGRSRRSGRRACWDAPEPKRSSHLATGVTHK